MKLLKPFYLFEVPVAGAVCLAAGFLFGLPALRLEGLDRSFAETLNLAAERIERITERLQDMVDQPDRARG